MHGIWLILDCCSSSWTTETPCTGSCEALVRACMAGDHEHSPRTKKQKRGEAFLLTVSGSQKGPAERGQVKKRRKSSKSVKRFFDTFRRFSRRAKNVKNRQKVSKGFSTLFDDFRVAPFSRPLLGSSDTVGAFLLTVKLLCLQSLEAPIRRTFPLQAKNSICK